MSNELYWVDKNVKKPSILCNSCALARNGLIAQTGIHLDLFSQLKDAEALDAGFVTYYYNENIDYDNYVTPMKTNSNLLLPTRERALVEYLLLEKWCDEGTLIEALKTYKLLEGVYDRLYEVADFYKLPRETLDYWIHEAETDEEV